jgi:hypothetical protein
LLRRQAYMVEWHLVLCDTGVQQLDCTLEQ